MNDVYRNAFFEVLKIIEYIPYNDYNKIPNELINFMNRNCNNSHSFEYNLAFPMNEQLILRETKVILSIMNEKFWGYPKGVIMDENDFIEETKDLAKLERNSEGLLLKFINKIKNIFGKK